MQVDFTVGIDNIAQTSHTPPHTSMLTTLQHNQVFVNWDDVDPISLTPVRDLATFFDLHIDKRNYRYDAWSWLEYICTEAKKNPVKFPHPLFKTLLSQEDRLVIYQVCKQSATAPSDRQKQLLKQCESKGIVKSKVYDDHQNLVFVNLRTVSPLLQLNVVSAQNRYDNSLDIPHVTCTAKIACELLDAGGNSTKSVELYI
ncbi:hypothetical protein OAM67_00275 [bacterium]|nr:hypothetical protein [bacterium]